VIMFNKESAHLGEFTCNQRASSYILGVLILFRP
jgi:hypothetical protein